MKTLEVEDEAYDAIVELAELLDVTPSKLVLAVVEERMKLADVRALAFIRDCGPATVQQIAKAAGVRIWHAYDFINCYSGDNGDRPLIRKVGTGDRHKGAETGRRPIAWRLIRETEG